MTHFKFIRLSIASWLPIALRPIRSLWLSIALVASRLPIALRPIWLSLASRLSIALRPIRSLWLSIALVASRLPIALRPLRPIGLSTALLSASRPIKPIKPIKPMRPIWLSLASWLPIALRPIRSLWLSIASWLSIALRPIRSLWLSTALLSASRLSIALRPIWPSIALIALCLSLPLPALSQRLVVTEPVIDCGHTGYRQPVTATFELRNKSLRRLVISDVHPGCNCTSVEYPREVGVGDKFTIKMTYDASQLGHFYKEAMVVSNGTKSPLYLSMKGIVLKEAQTYTGSYPFTMGNLLLDKDELEWDDVNRGDTPVQEIHVMNNSSEALTPRLLHLPSYLSATYAPETLQPGHSGTITVSLESEKLHGYGLTQSQVFMAQKLGEKVKADRAIDLSVILLPDLKEFEGPSHDMAPQLQISDTDFDFTDFGGKSKKNAEVMLANTGKSTLRISSMQMFTSGLKVTLGERELAPGQTTTLKITAYADELSQVKSRPRILMITNDPDHPKVVIHIRHKK